MIGLNNKKMIICMSYRNFLFAFSFNMVIDFLMVMGKPLITIVALANELLKNIVSPSATQSIANRSEPNPSCGIGHYMAVTIR